MILDDRAAKDMKRVSLLIRAAGDPVPLVPIVRRDVRDAAAGNAVTSSYTFDQIRTVMGQEILVGTALSADCHRDAADGRRHLRRAGVLDYAAVEAAGGTRGHR